jgi:hypothetical protein
MRSSRAKVSQLFSFRYEERRSFNLNAKIVPRNVAAGLTSLLSSERTGQVELVAGSGWRGHGLS